MGWDSSLSYILAFVLLMLEATKGWSHEELIVLTEHFKDLNSPPSFPAVRAFIEKYPMFKQRTKEQIEVRVWAVIKKQK